MKINQIGITIYDNKPHLPANKWFDAFNDSEESKNRFKLELNFLHKGPAIKLRGQLTWPPNQLRRLNYWDDHKDFYESCVQKAHNINCDIRAGKISARIPALIAIPNMNESFQTADKRKHYKWVMPQSPTAVIATRQLITHEFYQWHLHWIGYDFEQEFILNDSTVAESVPGRRGPSTRLYKAFPGPHIIDDRIIQQDYDTNIYIKHQVIDEAYEEFKQRVLALYACGTEHAEQEALAVLKQFPAYAEKWSQE